MPKFPPIHSDAQKYWVDKGWTLCVSD